MSRVLAVTLAALLLIAGAGPTAPASAAGPDATGAAALPGTPPASVPTQVAPPNTTAVLLLGADERGAVHDPSVDLSASLSSDRAVTAERLAREQLQNRYAAADTAERRDVLTAALDRIEERTNGTNAAQRRLYQHYANGTETVAGATTGFGSLDARARALGRTLTFVENRIDENEELRSRVNDLDQRLASVRGPVRERIAAAVSGSPEVTRVYVAGTDSGVRLATVDDGVHYHETSRPATGDSTGDSASIEEAERRMAELYPWAWNNSQGTTVDVIGADTYRVTVEHPHGSLVSYIDAASLRVVREINRQEVSSLPTGPGVSRSQAGLRVAVNRSYPGGPLRIAASDGAGATNATVRVDDAVVGVTGDDGELWTVSPDGGPDSRFIVTAERGNTQVSVIVQPIQPSSGT